MNSSGAMGFFVPTLTSTVCTIKVKDFPFDEQRCSINVMAQSFALNEYGIDAVYDPDALVNSPGRSLGNGEWQVLNISLTIDYVNTGQLINSYEVSKFVFHLKRNPSFYITMVITPSFVINVLSILGVFLKAADSMGKVSFVFPVCAYL
ncbi:unnamed protein product [Heligmosomoides polygyrus]|uniref:Neur_chan_LBD domain-containing protein n=1 Tax=Heligmosomoides polygyrus TaxID=6339 RepID=A0A183GI47_HELPZ|nr:unnamed protein product [Heligmosomoides polygyrus]